MVQEVHGGYDAYSAMLRQNPSYGNMHHLSGYNATFSATSGQHPQGMQYAGPEYYQHNPLQSSSDAASWYPSSSVSPPTSTSRQGAGGSVLLDHEWPTQTQYVGNVTVQSHDAATSQMTHHLHHVGAPGSATPTGSGTSGGSGNSAYASYRGSGCLPNMPTDYATSSSASGGMVTSGMTSMTPSPTPGGVVMGGSPPGGSGGNGNRQTTRPPYDWMKKASYPSTPTNVSANELGFVGKGHSSKTRTKDKYRVVYTDHQRLELEKEFHYSRYITIRRKAELAQALALSERQVKIWFQNRRAKERKQNKKREETLGIKTERPDSLPLMSPLGGGSMCDQVAPQHCGGGQQQQQGMLLGTQHVGGLVTTGGPIVGSQSTGDMSAAVAALHGHHQPGGHTPPMSAHSPPLAGHHS